MPRPDNRIAPSGRKPDIAIDHTVRQRVQTATELRDLHELARGNLPHYMIEPGVDRFASVEDAVRTLGLDAERSRLADRLIRQVAVDARDLLGVSKAAREGGIPDPAIRELIRRGMAIWNERKQDDMNKAKAAPEGTRSTHGGRPVIKRGGKWVPAPPEGEGKVTTGRGVTTKERQRRRLKAKQTTKDRQQDPKGKPPPKPEVPAKGAPAGGGKESDVHTRFREIRAKAKKAGIRIVGKVSDQHTHDHLDELESRIANKVAGRFKTQRGEQQAGAGQPQGQPVEPGRPGEAPPQQSPAQGSGEPGGQAPQPPTSEPGPHTDHQVNLQVADLENRLKSVESKLDSPHQKGFYKELLRDVAAVRQRPSPEAAEWLSNRVLSFIALVTGIAMGNPALGAAAAVQVSASRGQLVPTARKSLHLVLNPGGDVFFKAERDPADREGPSRVSDPTEEEEPTPPSRLVLRAFGATGTGKSENPEDDDDPDGEIAKSIPHIAAPLRSLLKSRGVLVQGGFGEVRLTGDLAKAGVPEHMLSDPGSGYAVLDEDEANDLYRHLGANHG